MISWVGGYFWNLAFLLRCAFDSPDALFMLHFLYTKSVCNDTTISMCSFLKDPSSHSKTIPAISKTT